MSTIILPTVQKSGSNTLVSWIFLALVLGAIAYVLYWMGRHQHSARKAKKRGDSPHTGHRGNH